MKLEGTNVPRHDRVLLEVTIDHLRHVTICVYVRRVHIKLEISVPDQSSHSAAINLPDVLWHFVLKRI